MSTGLYGRHQHDRMTRPGLYYSARLYDSAVRQEAPWLPL